MTKSKKSDALPNFEKTLAELEALVKTLEEEDLSLEESLRSFERGVALTRTCQQALKEAEQKIEILSKTDSEESLEPFEPEQ